MAQQTATAQHLPSQPVRMAHLGNYNTPDEPSVCSVQCPRMGARGLIPESVLCGCAASYGAAGDRCGACPGPYDAPMFTTDVLPACPNVGFGPAVWYRF
jgi:hypothetical protein